MTKNAHTSVIIPVYNLAQRGLGRVWFSLYSIALNSVVPHVVVMDGSMREQYEELRALIQDFPFVEHVYYPQQRYNMPILFNRGIERTSAPYLFCTGADFLYGRDFFECLAQATRRNRFILVPVRMLPRFGLTRRSVEKWTFPPSRPNRFGGWADGLQCFHRWWYDYAGGFDERMYGWGGMDNDHHFRAQRYGLECHWLNGSEVLHIWHRTEKATGSDARIKQRQSRANWNIRDEDQSIKRNQRMKREIRYQIADGKLHTANIIVKDQREKIQATWMLGNFYETQRHGMLNFVYRKFQGGTFIDVGASIGNHSLFFVRCCNAARVFAFEPVKDSYDHLLENLQANGIDNVDARNTALGATAGEVGITFADVTPEHGGMLVGRVDESGSGVRVERLDDILRGEGVQDVVCIKIDVEGYTLPVLQGARQTIKTYHPAVFCECETLEEFEEVNDYLAPLCYRVWRVNGEPFAMNRTATYLWEYEEAVDITILITTYNRPEQLQQLLEGLMEDAQDLMVRCVVYDDASDVAYEKMPAGNESFQIEYVRLARHHGKTEYWKMIKRAYQDLRGTRSTYYVQIPDDVRVKPGFLAHALETYQSITDPDKICLNLYLDYFRIGRTNWTHTVPRIVKCGKRNVFKIGWVDLCFVADGRFFDALDYEIKPIPRERWQRNPRLSSGVGKQITERLNGYAMYQVRECYLESVNVPSALNPDRPKDEDLATTQLDPIICGVASIPDRLKKLRQAVESVLPFVDELHVYLNGYPTVPKYLDHPKISVYRSQDHGDWGDAGKFYTVGNKRGFYFAIDDDIVYPEDFVWKCVNAIRHHQRARRRMVVGFHGKVMAQHVRNYYRGHVKLYHSAAALEREEAVHVVGTCALAFHTDDLPLTFEDFGGPRNMADIHFSIACQKHKVGCVVLPRPRGYLQIQKIPQEKTIWGQFHRNDKPQTDLYNSWTAWRLWA